ncbi:MAG: DUF3014 domain-containing protein [Pseudomonadales bacterium]|nr:DUF3014 domain-containing protein [Pseudomonadales bacterium]
MWKVVLAVALVAAAGLAGWFWLGRAVPPAASPAVPPPQLAAPDAPAGPADRSPAPVESTPLLEGIEPVQPLEPDWALPTLDQSDAFLRDLLADDGLPAGWLAQEEFVRRLAVLLENGARGEYPRRQVAFLVPRPPFAVLERDGRLYLDPANYARFDTTLDILEGIDPYRLARILTFVKPLVRQALTELGVDADPDQLLGAAFARVLDLPPLPDEIELVRPNVLYKYADPDLEALSPLQKQVLRTGPRNVVRLQAYVRRLAGIMGIRIPPPGAR